MKFTCIGILIYATQLLLFITQISGQQTNPFPANALTSSSYNGKAFGANYYIGQPVISFPLFNYQRNDLDLSLSLQYNPTGISLEQVASIAGLGWNLNTVGFVKRTIVGPLMNSNM